MTQLAETLVAVQTKPGLANLTEELLTLERGEEPKTDNLLAAIEQIAAAPTGRHAGQVKDLCARLTSYLEELREDGFSLCLDDLDVLLDGNYQLTCYLAEQVPALDLVQRVERASQESIDVHALLIGASPIEMASGLRTETRDARLRISVPSLETKDALNAAFKGFEELWNSDTQPNDWEIDFTRCERVPVALIAKLITYLREGDRPRRRIAIVGGFAELQSFLLHESLSHLFQLG